MKRVKRILCWFVCLVIMPLLSAVLQGMSAADEHELRWKVGQLLMVGMDGTTIDDRSPVVAALKEFNVGGIILFAKNISGREQLTTLTTQLQSYASTQLFLAVDAEGGRVNRLKPELGFIPVPSAKEMGSWADTGRTLEVARGLAGQLAAVGLNLNLAPVLDVDISHNENPDIGRLWRAFSDDRQEVIRQAVAFITAHHEYNVVTAGKHFPGLGSAKKSSHKGIVDVTDVYQSDVELFPFARLIEAGLIDMVMAAHIINRRVDSEYPATLSAKFLQDILRKQLGFDGVIISDDLCMGAIVQQYSFDQAVVRSLAAGCDILIISKNILAGGGVTSVVTGATASNPAQNSVDITTAELVSRAVGVICQAVKDGQLSAAGLLESCARVEKLKKKYGILKN